MSTIAERPALDTPLAPPPPNDTLGTPSAIVEQRIPTEVSAAWELELLIAGAVTFALFQLPGSLETLRASLEVKLTGGAALALWLGYVYAKMIVYLLIAAFLTNLTLRAYWVGLVGLHSVYPRGVVWDQMRLGPAAVEEYRERLASLPAIIGRVDNFASVIFSFAFMIVVVCVFSVVAAGVFGGLAWVIDQLAFGGRHSLAVFETLAFGFAIPVSTIGLIDKKFGPRWAPDSTAGRWLRRAVRATLRVNGSSLFGPIFFTLFTNLRRGVLVSLFYVTFFSALFVAMGEFTVRVGLFAPGSPRYMPDDQNVRGVNASHYESLRGPDANPAAVTIQSDVIEGPYVRLFIPYDAERHDPALAKTCAGAQPLRPGHVHIATAAPTRAVADRLASTVLGCLARMHAVTLDGAPQTDLQLRYYTQPTTGQPGMVAYLPTASLAPGQHVLSVMPPPRPPDSVNKTPLQPIEIPFWK